MTPGAKLVPAAAAVEASDPDRFEGLAHTLREDGAWIDSGENDNAIVQTLTRTPGSLGVFGYSFLEQNLDTVKAETIDGVTPNADTIASGEYPLSRSLFIYVKKAHIGVIPGLQQYIQEFLSEGSAGKGGYLADRGLIPLPEDQLLAQRATAAAMTPMQRPAK
jgi:phosphate transport system substrate-binding protein